MDVEWREGEMTWSCLLVSSFLSHFLSLHFIFWQHCAFDYNFSFFPLFLFMLQTGKLFKQTAIMSFLTFFWTRTQKSGSWFSDFLPGFGFDSHAGTQTHLSVEGLWRFMAAWFDVVSLMDCSRRRPRNWQSITQHEATTAVVHRRTSDKCLMSCVCFL